MLRAALNKPFPYVALLGLFFGVNLVVSRFCLTQIHPIAFVSLRAVLASLGYLVYFAVSRTRKIPTSSSLWLKAGFYGIISVTIPMVLYISSLEYQSSGITGLLQTLSPAMTVILAHFLLQGEPLSWRKAVGVIIAFIGAGSLLIQGESGLSHFARADWRGYAMTLAAVVIVAFSGIYGRRYLRFEDGLDVSCVRMFVATIACVLVALFTTGYDFSHLEWSGILGLLYSASFGTFFAFLLDFYITKRFGATAVSQTSYIIPVVATVSGALFLNEIITSIMFAGMAFIFCGLYLIGKTAVEEIA